MSAVSQNCKKNSKYDNNFYTSLVTDIKFGRVELGVLFWKKKC